MESVLEPIFGIAKVVSIYCPKGLIVEGVRLRRGSAAIAPSSTKPRNKTMIQIDDKELEQETKGMRIYGWESRNLGKGRKKLYIRMEPDTRAVKVKIHRGK